MKKLLLLALLGLLFTGTQLQAQTTTITTYYVIPPTSGCNGVWAISASQFAPCSVSQYTMNPMGCALFSSNQIGDTLFWALCNFPCDVMMLNPNSTVCICGTGTTVGMENEAENAVITTYPSPATASGGWNIWFHQPGNKVNATVYDASGKAVLQQSSESSDQVFHLDTSSLSAGIYFVSASINGGMIYRKLVITQ